MIASRTLRLDARVFLIVPAVLASACDSSQVCTGVGCAPSTYALTAAWTPGEYELDVSYDLPDRKSFTCAFSIPEGDRRLDDDPDPSCDHSMGGGSTVLLSASDGQRSLTVFDAPDRLELELRKDGETVVRDYVLTPEYETHYPNGPDCGSCRTSEMSILLADARED